MRWLRHGIAAAALVFFFTPMLLLAVGVRSSEFENRELAAAPRIQDGWDAFDNATRYLVDRLPLREQAVRFNTWKSLNVFGTTPTYGRAVNAMAEDAAAPFAGGAGAGGEEAAPPPDTANQVLRGTDDWLFLQGDVDRACSPFLPWKDAVERWERLGRIVRESGRQVVVVVAPDKTTIYPEYLPADLPNRACMEKGRDELWQRLESSAEPSILALREQTAAARDEFEHPVYFRADSHWNSAGSSVLVRSVVDRVGTRPIDPSAVIEADEREHVGDLGNLLGAPQTETEHVIAIEAPGEASLRGTTVFVHDSFGMGPLGALQAHSETFTTALWANDPPAKIVSSIAAADTVVLETVEREVTYRAMAVLTPEFLTSLERALARTEAR
jgi:hypothetical protein